MNNTPVFLTGATGVIGSYLAKILLEKKHKVFCLARPDGSKTARQRIVNAVGFWNENLLDCGVENLHVLRGDVVADNLGLQPDALEILRSEIVQLFHCAAVTDFSETPEITETVNIQGTKNILALADWLKKKGVLTRVNHISTAYVYSGRRGVFGEDDLDFTDIPDFAYVKSKIRAEEVIQGYRAKGLCINVYRPPFIVGDSETGKTASFKQLFYQLLQILNMEIFEEFVGQDIHLYLACVNEVAESIYRLAVLVQAENQNYHTFSASSISMEEIIDMGNFFLGFKKPRLVNLKKFTSNEFTPVQKSILKHNISLISGDMELDSYLTEKALHEGGFRFSRFNKCLFGRLIEYAVIRGFLKKRTNN